MNVPNFLLPLLDVESVGESLANAAYSGYGSTIYMPSLFNRLAITLVSDLREHWHFSPVPLLRSKQSLITMIREANHISFQRGGPEWIFRLVREGTTTFRIDFRGRQQLDAVTGKLQKA